MQPPRADRRPITTEHHGRSRVDDYEWLREKDSPEVRAYLDAENAYTEDRTAHLADLRLSLAADLLLRTDATVDAIARKVGYANSFALSTAFKRVRGVSPQEHRSGGQEPGPAATPPVPTPPVPTPPDPAPPVPPVPAAPAPVSGRARPPRPRTPSRSPSA